MKAYDLSDGSAKWFVRGTTDVTLALREVLDTFPEAEEEALDGTDDDLDYELVAEVERVGWFRFSPCWCGEHGWHLDTQSGPKRGNFEGVWLDVRAVEQIFESDPE